MAQRIVDLTLRIENNMLAPDCFQRPVYVKAMTHEPVSYTHLDVYKRQVLHHLYHSVLRVAAFGLLKRPAHVPGGGGPGGRLQQRLRVCEDHSSHFGPLPGGNRSLQMCIRDRFYGCVRDNGSHPCGQL